MAASIIAITFDALMVTERLTLTTDVMRTGVHTTTPTMDIGVQRAVTMVPSPMRAIVAKLVQITDVNSAAPIDNNNAVTCVERDAITMQDWIMIAVVFAMFAGCPGKPDKIDALQIERTGDPMCIGIPDASAMQYAKAANAQVCIASEQIPEQLTRLGLIARTAWTAPTTNVHAIAHASKIAALSERNSAAAVLVAASELKVASDAQHDKTDPIGKHPALGNLAQIEKVDSALARVNKLRNDEMLRHEISDA